MMQQMTTVVVQALNGLSAGVPLGAGTGGPGGPGGGGPPSGGGILVSVLVVFLRRFRMVVEVDRQVDQLRFRMKGRCPST